MPLEECEAADVNATRKTRFELVEETDPRTLTHQVQWYIPPPPIITEEVPEVMMPDSPVIPQVDGVAPDDDGTSLLVCDNGADSDDSAEESDQRRDEVRDQVVHTMQREVNQLSPSKPGRPTTRCTKPTRFAGRVISRADPFPFLPGKMTEAQESQSVEQRMRVYSEDMLRLVRDRDGAPRMLEGLDYTHPEPFAVEFEGKLDTIFADVPYGIYKLPSDVALGKETIAAICTEAYKLNTPDGNLVIRYYGWDSASICDAMKAAGMCVLCVVCVCFVLVCVYLCG